MNLDKLNELRNGFMQTSRKKQRFPIYQFYLLVGKPTCFEIIKMRIMFIKDLLVEGYGSTIYKFSHLKQKVTGFLNVEKVCSSWSYMSRLMT